MIIGLPLSFNTAPLATIFGCDVVMLCSKLPPFPLWSYHFTTNPSPAPQCVSNADSSRLPLLSKPISNSTLEPLRTRIQLPVYAVRSLRTEYAILTSSPYSSNNKGAPPPDANPARV